MKIPSRHFWLLSGMSILLALVVAVPVIHFQARAQTTSSSDPAVFLGKPNGKDTFSNANNWTTYDSECFISTVAGGTFNMTAKGIPQYSCWEVSWPQVDNYYLETRVQTPATCDPKDRFGLFYRAPDNYRGYLFGMDCNGQLSLNVYDGIKTTELLKPTTSPAIQKGANVWNRIGVAVYGPNHYLYANGVYVSQVVDTTFTGLGKIGYFVRAATENPFQVHYDDMAVWLLEEAFYPPITIPPPYPPVVPQPPSSRAPTATATTAVNIRSGPSTQYPIYGVAPEGASALVLGISPDRGWYMVAVPTSVSGNGTAWVSASYATLSNPSNQPIPVVQPPPPPPGVPVIPPTPSAPYVVFVESATVRSGPTSAYPVYGIVNQNVQAAVAGKSQDGLWWAISLSTSFAPDGLGWVYGAYTVAYNTSGVKTLPNPPMPDKVTPSVPGSGAPAAITIEPINVRGGPGNAYPSYGTVPIGTIMALTGISPDSQFYVIKLPTTIAKDGKGWVPVRYCKVENASSLPVVQPPPVP